MYEKTPTYACGHCHKTFKNERAFDAHNAAVHAKKPLQEDRLVSGVDLSEPVRRQPAVRDGNASNLVFVDEAAEMDPKWFEKL